MFNMIVRSVLVVALISSALSFVIDVISAIRRNNGKDESITLLTMKIVFSLLLSAIFIFMINIASLTGTFPVSMKELISLTALFLFITVINILKRWWHMKRKNSVDIQDF